MGCQGVELVVFEVRQRAARNGQRVGMGVVHALPCARGRGAQKGHVKAGVVRHQRAAACKVEQAAQRLPLFGGAFDHLIGDAGELGDLGRNGLLGVDKSVKARQHSPVFDQHGADLGQAVGAGREPCRLNVKDDKLVVKRGALLRPRPVVLLVADVVCLHPIENLA